MGPTRCPHCNTCLNWGDNPPSDMLCPSCRQPVDVVPDDKPGIPMPAPPKPPARVYRFPGRLLAEVLKGLAVAMFLIAALLAVVALRELGFNGDKVAATIRGSQALGFVEWGIGLLLLWASLTLAGRSMLALEKMASHPKEPRKP